MNYKYFTLKKDFKCQAKNKLHKPKFDFAAERNFLTSLTQTDFPRKSPKSIFLN